MNKSLPLGKYGTTLASLIHYYVNIKGYMCSFVSILYVYICVCVCVCVLGGPLANQRASTYYPWGFGALSGIVGKAAAVTSGDSV